MDANKRPVLVVDDDPFIREVLSTYLRSHECDVVVAGDGEQAISLLELGVKPSLAFIDIIMPHKEGIETIVAIKERVQDVKIIAISGGGTFKADDLLRYAEKLGADDSIIKPLDFDSLDIKIKRLLPN